jgi:branched-chain amino acid transport system ATP-binding protein
MSAAIELKQVYKSFGSTEIIRGVDLRIEAGERHAIIGPNGAGKSTLFNLITGRLGVSSGEIEMHGEPITHLMPQEINRKGLSRSFQVTNIFPRLSVFENVRCALLWSRGYQYSFWQNVDRIPHLNDETHQILEDINLAKKAQVPAAVLTYAEQRALEIGITSATHSTVIMLDEPTAGMSRFETEQAIALIEKVTQGKTLVMVEHDMGVVFGLADRISVLVYGQVIATGKPEDIRGNPDVRTAYLGEEADHVASR